MHSDLKDPKELAECRLTLNGSKLTIVTPSQFDQLKIHSGCHSRARTHHSSVFLKCHPLCVIRCVAFHSCTLKLCCPQNRCTVSHALWTVSGIPPGCCYHNNAGSVPMLILGRIPHLGYTNRPHAQMCLQSEPSLQFVPR